MNPFDNSFLEALQELEETTRRKAEKIPPPFDGGESLRGYHRAPLPYSPVQSPDKVQPFPTYPLFLIEWLDERQPVTKWEFMNPETKNTYKVVSIGYLVRETKDSITLAPNVANYGKDTMQTTGHITILKRSFVSTMQIKYARLQLG